MFFVPAVGVSLLAGVPSVSCRCPVGALSVSSGVRYVMYWFGMPGPPFRCFCGLYDQCCVSFLCFSCFVCFCMINFCSVFLCFCVSVSVFQSCSPFLPLVSCCLPVSRWCPVVACWFGMLGPPFLCFCFCAISVVFRFFVYHASYGSV